MSELYEKTVKEGLEYAEKLHLANMSEAATALALKCVREAAAYNGLDVLEFFFGEGVYGNVRGDDAVGAAASLVLLAKCSARLYAEIARSGKGFLESAGEKTGSSNRSMLSFFKWVSIAERTFNMQKLEETSNIMADAYRTVKKGEKVKFKIAASVQSRVNDLSLLDIVKQLKNGKLRIDGEELR